MLKDFRVSVDAPDGMEKPYRADVCNICGSSQYRKAHYFAELKQGPNLVKDVSVVQCRNCKVRRRMPGIIDDFEAEYHLQYMEAGWAIHPHPLSHFVDLMTVRMRQWQAKNVTFLDVGCSTGRTLRLAAALGFQVTGLDYSRWAAEYCSKLGFATRQGSLIGQWEKPELFEIIHCSHTIEHVPDPIMYLREMHRLLKPEGHLMLACPNYASLPRILKREEWPLWCLDSHLWHFTAGQMQALLVGCGFRPLSVRTLHGYTPRSRFKKKTLDIAAAFGFGEVVNIIATRG